MIDLQLSPLGLAAMDALGVGRGEIVLDVGCGTGQTLLQLAERVGAGGQVIGVDIAPLLLDVARQRTQTLGQVSLFDADAQALDLPSTSADAVFSRFGVMGFADPVAAFANFARMLKPAGKLAFVCWRSPEQNELDRFPLAAAGFESAAADTPFSFADPDHIRGTLAAAGFGDIAIWPLDQMVSSGDVDAMSQVLSKVGPLGRILRENPALRATAESRLRKALAALGDPTSVELRASVWIVTARAEATTR
ncbi:class I SAM-dependent methyltransferase [Aminobacter sp. UC22_36]|uniref:class I SAM-dependent methyltransferase n=1 Tax=Aminobacter sp. UC22_36 TaxID=3374549 RepID=UPI0037581721